jgi:hypothetical protein
VLLLCHGGFSKLANNFIVIFKSFFSHSKNIHKDLSKGSS